MSLERPMSGYGEINEEPAIMAGQHLKEVRREEILEKLQGYVPSREVSAEELTTVMAEAKSAEASAYESMTGAQARQELLRMM